MEELAVSLEEVQGNFERYSLLDQQVRFLKGWFKDTLPSAPIDKLAIARLDGDMYSSTIEALESLYPKISYGGYIIIDDFVLPSCAKAVNDYRDKYKIIDEIISIDSESVFWQKGTGSNHPSWM